MNKNCLLILNIPLSFISFDLSKLAIGMYITEQGTRKERLIISTLASIAIGGTVYGIIKYNGSD